MKYALFKNKSQEIGAINPTTTAAVSTGNTAEDFRKKHSNIKFHENPLSGSPVVGGADGGTDRQTCRS